MFRLAIREVYVYRRCFWNKLNSLMKLNLTLSPVGLLFAGEAGLVRDGLPPLVRCMSEVKTVSLIPPLRPGSTRKIGNGDRKRPCHPEVTFTWCSSIRLGVAKFVRHGHVLSCRQMN